MANLNSASSNVVEVKEEKQPSIYKLVLKRQLINGKYVHWRDDVIDNEHLGKKSSKICCVYHKPRRFDESDSEESDWEPDRTEYPWWPEKKKTNTS